MNLNSLSNALSSLGPWGLAAGVGLTLLSQSLWGRLRRPPAPVTPTPNASPATSPQRLDARWPLVHLLLRSLGKVPSDRPATADVSHDLILQLRGEVGSLSEAQAAGHAAALGDLSPPAPAPEPGARPPAS